MGSWADAAIELLLDGQPATVIPRGNSMLPRIKSGAQVDLVPVQDPSALRRGDVVLVKVKGSVYLHLVSATDCSRVQISNNKGRVNGWVARDRVYGLATAIRNVHQT